MFVTAVSWWVVMAAVAFAPLMEMDQYRSELRQPTSQQVKRAAGNWKHSKAALQQHVCIIHARSRSLLDPTILLRTPTVKFATFECRSV